MAGGARVRVAPAARAARAQAARSGALPARSTAPTAPTAPTALAAGRSGSSASLRWTNNATIPAATAIQLKRATDARFTQNVITFTVGPNATSYLDKRVAPDTTYRYRVRAQNGASDSRWSNVVSFMRPSTATPVSFFGAHFACARYCDGSFGWNQNTSVVTADSVPTGTSFTNMLRVTYPKGSINSDAVTKLKRPLGGAQAAIPSPRALRPP